jgi:hypothetical protein
MPDTRWLIAAAVAAVALAAGLYGARAGWFGGADEEELAPPQLGQAPPERPVDTHDDAPARADWGAPEGTPVVGVGAERSDAAPAQATLRVADGRADVAIRVPRAKADGTPYTGYMLEVRAGERRVWGGNVPARTRGGADDRILLSLNAAHLGAAGAEPVTVVVGGSAPRKGDTLGMVRLTVQRTP